MSLEASVEALTKAIENLTAKLCAPVAVSEAEKPTPKKATKKAEPKEEKPAAKKEEAKVEFSEEDYAPIKKATLDLVKIAQPKGKEVVGEILSKYGKNYKNAKDLSPDQYDDYLADVQAKIAEYEDEDVA